MYGKLDCVIKFAISDIAKGKDFTLDPFGIAVSSTKRHRILQATKSTEIAWKRRSRKSKHGCRLVQKLFAPFCSNWLEHSWDLTKTVKETNSFFFFNDTQCRHVPGINYYLQEARWVLSNVKKLELTVSISSSIITAGYTRFLSQAEAFFRRSLNRRKCYGGLRQIHTILLKLEAL